MNRLWHGRYPAVAIVLIKDPERRGSNYSVCSTRRACIGRLIWRKCWPTIFNAKLGITLLDYQDTRITPMDKYLRRSRRDVLIGGLALLGISGLPAAARAAAEHAHKHKKWPCGVQLWTVAAELNADIPGTLKALKGIGYETVETAGLLGHTAKEFRALIEGAGLSCRSVHNSMIDLIGDLDQKIEDAVGLGATWLVCASPKPPAPLDPKQDWVAGMIAAMTLDAWKYNADQLARMAPIVTKAGLKFAYHNHPMEFVNYNGTSGYDVLLNATDADHLRLEMDLGWVLAGGCDPVVTMKAYGSRIDLLHVKDMIKDPATAVGYRSVEVGKGLIDWHGVFAAAHEIGVKGYFIEQEAPFIRPALQSLAISHEYVSKL
jgi:sugar phosphate isomerase/epimerase